MTRNKKLIQLGEQGYKIIDQLNNGVTILKKPGFYAVLTLDSVWTQPATGKNELSTMEDIKAGELELLDK